MGALTLTTASTLDFGSGSGEKNTLQFASLTDSSNAMLTVNDYMGSLNMTTDSGSNDQLLFTTDPTADLADIQFNIGWDDVWRRPRSRTGSEFEVVPTSVPEPSTIVAGLFLLGLLGWRSRGRLGEVLQSACQS